MGMSCSGKTTFAKRLTTHQYYCFDACFDWHSIETLGLSMSAALMHVRDQCTSDTYILDGWHISDALGRYMPEGASVYVVYADYDYIINQYRVPVMRHDVHRSMFKKWYYDVDYTKFNSRYFENTGDFIERTPQEFRSFLAHNQ